MRSSRPRGAVIKEELADNEEQVLWDQIKKDLEKCRALQKRQIEVSNSIVELEIKMSSSPPSVKDHEALEALYREMIKLSEDEPRLLTAEPADLLKNISILAALRTATTAEPEVSLQRASQGKGRSKGKQASTLLKVPEVKESSPIDSSISSISTVASTVGTRNKNSSNRTASANSSVRELRDSQSAAKVEDTSEATKGVSDKAGTAKFVVGAQVAYRQSKVREDGSQWIQCEIITVIEKGNKKMYEVQDPEPDETGQPGDTYRAMPQTLIAIPDEKSASTLPDIPAGKTVLAKYPETTTFYKAEVTGKKEKDGQRFCLLNFEDDANQEMAVQRRFVLDYPGR